MERASNVEEGFFELRNQLLGLFRGVYFFLLHCQVDLCMSATWTREGVVRPHLILRASSWVASKHAQGSRKRMEVLPVVRQYNCMDHLFIIHLVDTWVVEFEN